MTEKRSFVKAVILFFEEPPHGRKMNIPEFKELTTQDKIDLSQMLNEVPRFEHVLYTGERTT